MAVAIMSGATLADMHGRRKLYIAGIVLFTASSIACGMAATLDMLNVARTVQGIAAATVNVTSLALVSAAFPEPKQKARAIGIWTAIASTATAIGPTLGGLLVQSSGWRSIFLVNIPVGIVAVILTLRFVAESRDARERRFDIPGQFLFGLSSLITGLGIMIVSMPASIVAVVIGFVFAALGGALCLTPITSLAMTAVPPERAGMASGIMSAQRAIGSTVGFAVLGSILAAWLAMTLDRDLAAVLPDSVERREVAMAIVGNANPRAFAAEIGPGRPIQHESAVLRDGILLAADADFVQGIRLALATAVGLLAIVLAAGIVWFPRHKEAIADAEHEAVKLEKEEEGGRVEM